MATPDTVIGQTILINSVDRIYDDDNPWDFTVDLSNPKVNSVNGDVTVKWVSIPSEVYNVNEFTNVFTWQEDVDAKNDPDNLSITLTPKNYTGPQLASQLETDMTIESAANGKTITYTVSYDSQTAKFTFSTTTASVQIRLRFGESSFPMSRLLGFTNGATTEYFHDAADLTSTKLAELYPALSYQVHIEGYFDGQRTSDTYKVSSLLLAVQARVPFGYILFYSPTDSLEAFHIRDLFGKKRISLYADYGNGIGPQFAKITGDWEMFLVVRKTTLILERPINKQMGIENLIKR